MNISTPLGFICGIAVIYYAANHGIKNPDVFFSPHAAIIVIGGTAAAALICFPLSHFFNLFKIFIRTLFGQVLAQQTLTINEIVKLSEVVNQGRPISNELSRIKNPFLKESLLLLTQGGLTNDELEEILEKRVELQNEKYKREGFTFKIIGKFPPAFGLVGTTLGMIVLLQGIGSPDAFDHIGPSMSIALVATFYGLVFANVFLIPMGENLTRASEDDLIMRRIVVDGVRLLREQKHPLLVEEYLKSYLAPAERTKMKKASV
ncbi:MotA/TolQ/ExbB proton channel family protein [Bdellovibrionota bacterium FG-1]